MCTIILLYKTVPGFPMIIAANRDEFINRSALAPHLWQSCRQGKTKKMFAGKDQQAGGTWLGINNHGVVAGLTNYSTGYRDLSKASRGDIVLKCLAADNPVTAKKKLFPEETAQYNPFNLFCISPEEGFLYTNYPSPRCRPINKGIHVLTNKDLDSEEDPKKNWILQRLKAPAVPKEPKPLMALFSPILSAHGHEGTAEICIHLKGYGTVSSSMIFIHQHWEESRYFYCQGAPCRKSFQDLSPSFVQLFDQ